MPFARSISLFFCLAVVAINAEDEESAYARAERLQGEALTFYHAHRYDDALRAFSESVRLNRFNPTVWNNYGIVQFMLGLYEDAETSFRRSLKLVPDDEIVRANLDGSLAAQGKPPASIEYRETTVEVMEDYERGVAQEAVLPNDSVAWSLLARDNPSVLVAHSFNFTACVAIQHSLDRLLASLENVVPSKYSAPSRDHLLFLYRIGVRPDVRTVCEIGFGAGHTAAAWLYAAPDAVLYAFDKFRTEYALVGAQFIRKVFGHDRLISIPTGEVDGGYGVFRYAQRNAEFSCDVVSLAIEGWCGDDAHDLSQALEELQSVSTRDTVVVVAGLSCGKEVERCLQRQGWRRWVASGKIREFACEQAGEGKEQRGWCAGRFAIAVYV